MSDRLRRTLDAIMSRGASEMDAMLRVYAGWESYRNLDSDDLRVVQAHVLAATAGGAR